MKYYESGVSQKFTEPAGNLYQQNILAILPFNKQISLKMKAKFLAALMLIVVTIVVTSCYSSRKSGCPGNPQANYKFRG